jgi:general secretion pathway protein E
MSENFESKSTDIQTLNEKIEIALLEQRMVPEEALKTSKMESEITGEDLTKILVRNGFVSQDKVLDIIIDLDTETLINEEIIIPTIKPEVLEKHKTIINAITDKVVFFGTNSNNGDDIAYMLKQNYFPKHTVKQIPANPEKISDYLEKIKSIYDDDGSMVERIIRKAIKEDVSDIHIVPHYDTYTVLFRYLGVRHPDYMGTKDEYQSLGARIKDLSKMDMSERRKPQDGGFQIDYNGRFVDLRVATVPTNDGEIIIIRILDPEKAQLSLEGLGISGIEEWRMGASRSDGLCLICGPTGSGKTTTLNSTLREQDRFGKAIFTIEDPVEYRIPYIGQVNINTNVGLDFARAIKAFMRSDPDVIVVGEVRDDETARNAIKAAETGHLVFATLHTGSIPGAVSRLRDLGVEGHELKYVLRSVLAQRLMRVVCHSCNGSGMKEKHHEDHFDYLSEENSNLCPICQGKGYSGRTIVSEVKYFSEMQEVLSIMSNNEKDAEISWTTMLEDGYNKFSKGITSPGEFIRLFGPEAEKMLIQDGYDLDLINDKGFFVDKKED